MLAILLVIICSALINRLRGWSLKKNVSYPAWQVLLSRFSGKAICTVYLGMLFWLFTFDPIIGGIVTLGYMVWAVFGWGDYWDYSDDPNDEVWLIDVIVARYFKSGAMADFVSMSLRGVLGYPLFVMLAVYLGSLWPLLFGLGMAAQGAIYHVFFKLLGRIIHWEKAFITAELVMGGWIGALIIASLRN